MENLSLTEASVLKQFLTDPTALQALTVFLNNQREYHVDRSADLVLNHELDKAFEAAVRASVHETLMSELRHFAENQIKRAA